MPEFAAEFGHFPQDSETVALLRSTDWEATALGHPSTWPDALRLQLSVCFESAFPIAIWWGPDFIQFYNDAYRPILGATKHPRAFGSPAMETWPEIWSTIGPMVSQVVKQGVAVKGEDMPFILERNGFPELCHFTFSYSPIRNIGSQIGGMFTVAVETTKRVLTERRQAFLFDLQERLHSLAEPREIMMATAEMLGKHLDVDRCGYAEIDETGQYFDVLRDWTKGDMESLAGHHNLDNFGLAYIAELRQGRSAVFDDAHTSPLTQDEVAKATFSVVRTRAAISVPLVKDGRLAATLYLTQIAPRRWTEQEKLLASDVAERTWAAVGRARAELAKARIEEELKKKDRQKDEFLAMLAHELRNPLAPISAAAQLLQITRLDEARVKQTSDVIMRQIAHMTSLVDDLIDVSRVTKGLIKIEKIPLDVKRIIADAVEQTSPLIESKRHHLRVDLPREAVRVVGDQKRLVQVLVNILNNAAKYTPLGGNITLRLEAESNDVVISVADDGIGLSAELLPRVFDLFTQAERTPDRAQGGLGIGLALVKSLTELHGGKATVSSEGVNQGCKLVVCLPRLEEQVSSTRKQSLNAWQQLPGKALRVMIVDDNEDAAHMLALLIQTGGHAVVVEHSAKAALETSKRVAPELCILDIGLPEMDGNELASRLRAQQETAKSLLVAVTGYGQEEDRKRALASGFDYHLVKPVDTQKLADILARVDRA